MNQLPRVCLGHLLKLEFGFEVKACENFIPKEYLEVFRGLKFERNALHRAKKQILGLTFNQAWR